LNRKKAILTTYTYDSFGNEIETCGRPALLNRYRYTGREFDYFGASYETTLYSVGLGHYHNHARTYDQTLGRFLQNDPVWALNLYPYVNNNPVMMTDPYGEIILILIGIFVYKRWIDSKDADPDIQVLESLEGTVPGSTGKILDGISLLSKIGQD